MATSPPGRSDCGASPQSAAAPELRSPSPSPGSPPASEAHRPPPSPAESQTARKTRLFAIIRDDAARGMSTRQIASRRQIHRRMVRQPLAEHAGPPPRKRGTHPAPAIGPIQKVLDKLADEPLTIWEIWTTVTDEHDPTPHSRRSGTTSEAAVLQGNPDRLLKVTRPQQRAAELLTIVGTIFSRQLHQVRFSGILPSVPGIDGRSRREGRPPCDRWQGSGIRGPVPALALPS